jgi:hypothetical protein
MPKAKKDIKRVRAYAFVDKYTKQLMPWAMHTDDVERFLKEAINTSKAIKKKGHYYKEHLRLVPVLITIIKKKVK